MRPTIQREPGAWTVRHPNGRLLAAYATHHDAITYAHHLAAGRTHRTFHHHAQRIRAALTRMEAR